MTSPIYIQFSNVLIGLFDYICIVNKKHDRDTVLELGYNLFWCKGYNALGVNEICKTTGMAKGAFYNTFKSKENFLLLAIEKYGVMNAKYLSTVLSNKKNKPLDRIIEMYSTLFNNQPSQSYIGCMTNNIMSEISSSNELIAKATATNFETLIDVITPVINEAQQNGYLDPSLDARAITELIHSTFFGALTRVKSTKNAKQGVDTMTLLINSLKST